MANYAVIDDNKVINIIACESKEIAEQVTKLTCIEYTDENPVSIGYTWDGSVFTKPIEE